MAAIPDAEEAELERQLAAARAQHADQQAARAARMRAMHAELAKLQAEAATMPEGGGEAPPVGERGVEFGPVAVRDPQTNTVVAAALGEPCGEPLAAACHLDVVPRMGTKQRAHDAVELRGARARAGLPLAGSVDCRCRQFTPASSSPVGSCGAKRRREKSREFTRRGVCAGRGSTPPSTVRYVPVSSRYGHITYS